MREMFGGCGLSLSYRPSPADGELRHAASGDAAHGHIVTQTGVRRKPLRSLLRLDASHYSVVVNLRGTVLLRGEGQDTASVALPNSAILIQPGARVDLLFSRGDHFQHYFLWREDATRCLGETWAASTVRRADPRKYSVVACPSGTFVGEIFERLSTWARSSGETNCLRVLGCLHLLTAEAISQTERHLLTGETTAEQPQAVARLMDRVRENPTEPWPLKEAATFAGYSPFHLSRTFKQVVGYGFPEFVERCRTEIAISALLNSQDSVDEIAVDVGLSSAQSLREACRSYLGLMPSELRAFSMESSVLA